MEKEFTGLTSVNVREVDRTYQTLDKAERGIQLLTHELTKVCEFFIFTVRSKFYQASDEKRTKTKATQ